MSCPQLEKVYFIILICIIFCIVFAASLNTIKNDTVYLSTGSIIYLFLLCYTIYLFYIDFYKYYSRIASVKFNVLSYLYIPIILASSLYLLLFGLFKKTDLNDSDIILYISASVLGTIGTLFIFTDIVSMIFCLCK